MITLYGGSGSGQIIPTGRERFIDNERETLLFNASQLLIARDNPEAAAILATFSFKICEGTNDFGDGFCYLDAQVPLSQYEYLNSLLKAQETRKKYKEIFQELADVINEIMPSEDYIRFVTCTLDQSTPPDNWRINLSNTITALSSNQAVFTYKNSAKLIHDGLNFRSKTEIKMYDALVKKGLLVFPLPIAVMGGHRSYREPDFVVCYKGKTGILEIHGDRWHPPETAAKEHERRREFTRLGITIYEIFSAERCWNETEQVIAEFLRAFE